MSQCVNCGTSLPEHAKFCSNCGAAVNAAEAARCQHCGIELKPGAQFCHSCGQPVTAAGRREVEDAAVHESEQREDAAPAPRSWNWKTTLLPLLGIPVVIAIIFLLTYNKPNPQPVSESAAPAQNQTDGQGMNMAAMEEITKQIEKYKSDLQANPKDTTALLVLGHIYEIASRFDEAADYYRRYLEVVPDNVPVRTSLAGIYFNNNQRQQALAELQQVLKYQPNYDYAMYNLGVIYLHDGNKDEASKWWHKVMETNPMGELAEKAREQLKAMGGK